MTLLNMSIYGAVIILAIILIRAFTLHKLPKKTFLILWSVALLRLLVPFDISSEYSVYSLVPDEVAGQLSDISESITGQITDALLSERADNAAPDNTTTINNDVLTLEEAIQHLPQSQYKEQESSSSTENEAGQNTDNPIYLPTEDLTTDAIPLPNMEQNPPAEIVDIIIKEQPTLADWLFDSPIHLIWLIGVLLCTAFFLFFYIRAYIELSDATPVTDEYAKDFLKHHWTNRIIYLKQSDKISAPLTYGIFHPVILLPKKMDWENHDQLDYVLYHEFTHIRRFDLIPKLLMAAALCFHWFNPFVWAMYYFFNRDIELSCDECVVKYYEENHTKADYARTLINMEEKKSRITPLCNNFSKNAIEERITAIMKLKKTTASMIILGIVIVATVVITLTTSTKQPEAAISNAPTATPAPTMVPFKMIDFESGEFDEKGLAKTLWQKIASSAIGMLYGETNAYDVKNCEGPVFRKDTSISNLNIDISDYSTDREWMELGVFPEEEKSCYYVIYVLSAHTEITSGPGVLIVTVPADQPENYTVLPIGDAGELAPAALWFNNPVKVGTNMYFNSGSSGLWCLDTVTMKLNSLSYVIDALNARASAYLDSKGMDTSYDAIYYVNGQMGDHMVFSAENSESIMVYEQMPASGSIPTTDGPDWYNAVSELMHGNTPKDTIELPHNTVVPDYAISALKTQAASYLAQCGLGTEHYADCYAICKTGGYTVYGADISYSDDYNSPTYFTVYHAYKGDQLMEKVIFRHLITFYDTENPSHVWANYINMDDVVTMAKEELKKFCDTKNYSHTYKITSIHMTSFETLEVEFLIPETENFDIFTEATVEFTYDFTTEKWSVSYFREIPPDYLSSYASFPRLAAKDVTITGKDWCLTYINELDLPHFQELANAGGKITAELGDSLLPEENVYYTIALNGIEYFFYREKAPQNNNQAWNLAITSPDYPLSGGAKVGMTVKELLALYPDLAKTELDWDDIVFQALYGPSMFNFRDDQFPEGFLNNYDYAYTAYLEKGYDGLPVCIAFLINDTTVSAITVYMPTAD